MCLVSSVTAVDQYHVAPSRAVPCRAVPCCVLQGEIGGANSVLSAMLNEVSPSTGDYVRIGNIYGQVMNLMIAGERVERVYRTAADVRG